MKLFVPKETEKYETRAGIDPDSAKKLIALGIEVEVEKGIGKENDNPDKSFTDVGVKISEDVKKSISDADIVCRVRKPSNKDLKQLKKGALHISFLDPFNEKELIEESAECGVSAISLEMIPRTTLAQKMDAISSQANLAGYASVIYGAEKMSKIIPMMMTPAGTISPAKFFVIGIGVAGLQAIATAKRLGARVTAFDVRAEALEQAQSLGAKALRIDLGETGSTEQGYAKQLTPEQIEKQVLAQAKVCSQSDVVITTAKVFGRKSPILVKKDVIAKMQHGSVLIDLATESGGNVEGIKVNKETTTRNGVKLVGLGSIECRVAKSATQVFSSNIYNLIEHFWDEEKKSIKVDLDDPIMSGCLITNDGKVVHEKFK